MACNPTEFEYRPKIFNYPRNISSDKENMPPFEPLSITILNITESDFLDRTDSLLGKETKWEAHVAQQIPLPRASSPYPVDRLGSLEHLEPETDENMDIRDYMERPANDKGLPKPKCGPGLMIQNNFPSPQTCPDYIAMTTAAEPTKLPPKEIRGILPEKKKMPHGWSACLKRKPPKVGFQNNDIYVVHTSDEEHHYEEPKEKEEPQKTKEPQEKTCEFFIN